MEQDIITFWFEEAGPKQWWTKDPAFDRLIKDRFEAAYWAIVRGERAQWRSNPAGRLAEILVLDQFSRNMFRDTPQAFLYDPLALALAQEAIRAGTDHALDSQKRHFLYMPYMHSESRLIHGEALKLFEALGNREALAYEQEHKAIIDRFGRYPHRNRILGRESTAEEREFLKTHTGF